MKRHPIAFDGGALRQSTRNAAKYARARATVRLPAHP